MKYDYPSEMDQLRVGCELLQRVATRLVGIEWELSASMDHGELMMVRERASGMFKENELDVPALNEWVFLVPNNWVKTEEKSARVTAFLGFVANEKHTRVPDGWTAMELPIQRYARFPIYDQTESLSTWLQKKYSWFNHWHDALKPGGDDEYCLMIQSDEEFEVFIPYQDENA